MILNILLYTLNILSTKRPNINAGIKESITKYVKEAALIGQSSLKKSVTAIKRKGDNLNGCIQRQCYGNVAGNLSFHELERGAEADAETGICYKERSTSVGA